MTIAARNINKRNRSKTSWFKSIVIEFIKLAKISFHWRYQNWRFRPIRITLVILSIQSVAVTPGSDAINVNRAPWRYSKAFTTSMGTPTKLMATKIRDILGMRFYRLRWGDSMTYTMAHSLYIVIDYLTESMSALFLTLLKPPS